MLAALWPALLFLVPCGAAVYVCYARLPDLEQSRVGNLAYWVTCGFVGAAVGDVGLQGYLIGERLHQYEALGRGALGGSPTGTSTLRAVDVSEGVTRLLFECGLLLACAAAVYLLAPPPASGADRDTGND
jgi:hypothetical protein